jgi:hypothetical protein
MAYNQGYGGYQQQQPYGQQQAPYGQQAPPPGQYGQQQQQQPPYGGAYQSPAPQHQQTHAGYGYQSPAVQHQQAPAQQAGTIQHPRLKDVGKGMYSRGKGGKKDGTETTWEKTMRSW